MSGRQKRICAFIILCAIILCCGVHPQAHAEPRKDIRVYLRRLKIEDTIHIRINGEYMVNDGMMLLRDGTEMDIILRENQLIMHFNGLAATFGTSVTLKRLQSDHNSSLQLQYTDGLYEGDLSLSIAENVILPVLTINVEDYLLGVVPYEMGDSFPLEALKAQAIAARTYAMRKSGANALYDVEDTTNDQAYKGRSSSHPVSEQAVKETAGMCGVYKGSLAQCYYSASNGGQTELGQHVWPTSAPDAYGYMDMRDDPYDYENEASSVRRFTLNKRPGEEGIGAALHSVLVNALSGQLAALGYSAEDDLIRFDEILSLHAHTPKFTGDSRLMTELTFSVRLSVRDALFRDFSLADIEPVTPAPSATPSPTPAPTATPAYSDYRAIEQPLTVTVPYFTLCERAMGLSINVYENELITVLDIGSAYLIESRRFGHGVGMSQRGAEQMARKYGMTYEQILAFYYPSMTVETFDTSLEPLPTPAAVLAGTPVPTPSPTPRPTLMPVTTDHMKKKEYLAVVTNIDADSSLNLRQAPSLSAEVLRRLYKDQQLIVISTTADGWAHVRTDVIEGYVKTDYIQKAE